MKTHLERAFTDLKNARSELHQMLPSEYPPAFPANECIYWIDVLCNTIETTWAGLPVYPKISLKDPTKAT